MNTFHLTSPDNSADNSSNVIQSTLAVNQGDAPLAPSNVNVRKECAASMLPVLDAPDSPGVKVDGSFE